jgi:hypothetical protein
VIAAFVAGLFVGILITGLALFIGATLAALGRDDGAIRP